MINAIIVEDEIGHFEHITKILGKNHQEINVLGHAESKDNAIALIKKTEPELVFMDIQLKSGNGFEVLDHFGNDINFETIFTTSFLDYKEKAMDYFAFYYLNKPLDPEQLKTVLDRYLAKKTQFDIKKYLAFKKQLENKENSITISTSSGYETIDIQDIVYCEASGSYTEFHTIDQKKLISSNNLKKVENILAGANFCRIHRSILINLKHVKAFNSDGVIQLSNDLSVNIASRNKKNILKMLKLMYGML